MMGALKESGASQRAANYNGGGLVFSSKGGSQYGANSKRAFEKTESVINNGLGGDLC